MTQATEVEKKKQTMQLTLGRDMLCLCTSFEQIDQVRSVHTRSVVLCRRDNACYLLDKLSFTLLLSFEERLDVRDLIDFMVRSYGSAHFRGDGATHTPSGNGAAPSAVVARQLADRKTASLSQKKLHDTVKHMKETLRQMNTEAFELYTWKPTKSPERDAYADVADVMPSPRTQLPAARSNQCLSYNVNFVAKADEVKLKPLERRAHRGQKQYRLSFENHVILHYFVRRFKRPVVIDHVAYVVRVLDPQDRAALYKAEADQYVATQLQRLLASSMLFEKGERLVGGRNMLLHSACYTTKNEAPAESVRENLFEATKTDDPLVVSMAATAVSDTGIAKKTNTRENTELLHNQYESTLLSLMLSQAPLPFYQLDFSEAKLTVMPQRQKPQQKTAEVKVVSAGRDAQPPRGKKNRETLAKFVVNRDTLPDPFLNLPHVNAAVLDEGKASLKRKEQPLTDFILRQKVARKV